MRSLLIILDLAAPPGLTWVSATEGYLTLPVSQCAYHTANSKTITTDAWCVGLLAVGGGQGISRPAGLQFE